MKLINANRDTHVILHRANRPLGSIPIGKKRRVSVAGLIVQPVPRLHYFGLLRSDSLRACPVLAPWFPRPGLGAMPARRNLCNLARTVMATLASNRVWLVRASCSLSALLISLSRVGVAREHARHIACFSRFIALPELHALQGEAALGSAHSPG